MLQGFQQAAAHVQPESRQPVQGAHGQASDGGAAAPYMYDPAVAGALDARAAAAGLAAEKHLQVVEGAASLDSCRRAEHVPRGLTACCHADLQGRLDLAYMPAGSPVVGAMEHR